MDHLTDTPDNAVIFELCNCLKMAYLELRRLRTFSKVRRIAAKNDIPFWDLAKMLHGYKTSPFEYMEWAFDRTLERHDDVHANMVTSPSMVARYQDAVLDRRQELEVIVKLQAHLIKKREDRGESLEEILFDEEAHLSAVMRFAVAHSRGRLQLAENFREDAERQILYRPQYRELLGKFLPKEMQ